MTWLLATVAKKLMDLTNSETASIGGSLLLLFVSVTALWLGKSGRAQGIEAAQAGRGLPFIKATLVEYIAAGEVLEKRNESKTAKREAVQWREKVHAFLEYAMRDTAHASRFQSVTQAIESDWKIAVSRGGGFLKQLESSLSGSELRQA